MTVKKVKTEIEIDLEKVVSVSRLSNDLREAMTRLTKVQRTTVINFQSRNGTVSFSTSTMKTNKAFVEELKNKATVHLSQEIEVKKKKLIELLQ